MVKLKLLLALLFFSSFNRQAITSRQIIDKLFISCSNIQTLRYKLKKLERIGGELKAGEQDVKYNASPKKIYTNIIFPNKGVEVLYVEGSNNGDAYVNPNAFPYITLNLNPYGSLMRKENHHTVHEVGFDYITGILTKIANAAGPDFDNIFQYKGEVKFNNLDCYKIDIDYYPYKLVPYTVKEGENLTDIAYRLSLSDYMILGFNKEVDNFEDVKPGQKILIPNAYARRTVLYIDKQSFLPVLQQMYDEKGLFEQYEFYNVVVNSKIGAEEFSKENKKYGF